MAGYDEEQWARLLPPRGGAVLRDVPTHPALLRHRPPVRVRGPGRPGRAAHVQSFLDTLLAHGVLLAFDGLSGDSLDGLRNPRAGLHPVFAELQAYKARGGAIGLEALGPLFNPRMANTDAIGDVIETMGPQRLVLFNDIAADLLEPAAAARKGADVARRLMGRLTRA